MWLLELLDSRPLLATRGLQVSQLPSKDFSCGAFRYLFHEFDPTSEVLVVHNSF